MFRAIRPHTAARAAMGALILVAAGCTSPSQYIHNGLKVGPNYQRPVAWTATHWIDDADTRVSSRPADLSRWWETFHDPTLNRLIACAYHQNLTLREAGFRVLQARAQLGIAVGELFPQQQTANGSYRRSGVPGLAATQYSSQWNFNFNLAWELDFWGRFRRAVASAEDTLEAAVADYDGAMVTLFADIAANYVQVRTDQERIRLLRNNAALQWEILRVFESRLNVGTITPLDVEQARSTLAQTEAAIPQVEIDLRQAADRLCTLLGICTVDLQAMFGAGPIPTAPREVAIGIPCDLLRRRPDVRRAERLAAAQAEQIGIAEAALYPALSVSGVLGVEAPTFGKLFAGNAFAGSIAPSFQWNILNYGRIINNVRLQEARFQELVAAYQNTVLTANQEAEDGLATFLQSQERTRLLSESVAASRAAVAIVAAQGGVVIDVNRYTVIEQNLVQQQDLLAQAQGQIAQGLIQLYRALGGGWELRLLPPPVAGRPPAAEEVPRPLPAPPAPDRPAPPATAPHAVERTIPPGPPAPAMPQPSGPDLVPNPPGQPLSFMPWSASG